MSLYNARKEQFIKQDIARTITTDPIAWLDGTNEPTRWVDGGTHAEARDRGRTVFVPANHGVFIFPLDDGEDA